jgi:hypothetical protein
VIGLVVGDRERAAALQEVHLAIERHARAGREVLGGGQELGEVRRRQHDLRGEQAGAEPFRLLGFEPLRSEVLTHGGGLSV